MDVWVKYGLDVRTSVGMENLEFSTQTAIMTTTATSADSIFETNPYEMHPGLSPLEADVLWEYAKLSQHIKEVRIGVSFSRKMVERGWTRR
jgi:hypothetical protein